MDVVTLQKVGGGCHLSDGNTGVLRGVEGGQKPPVEQKGKSSPDLDFQNESRL